jgi:hypothetical protein
MTTPVIKILLFVLAKGYSAINRIYRKAAFLISGK